MQNQSQRLPALRAVVAAAFGSGRLWQFAFAVVFLLLANLPFGLAQQTRAPSLATKLRTHRSSSSDLELAGDLANVPAKSTRYITREDLLALPQVSFTVTNDPNFTGPTQISGVSLDELVRQLSASPNSDLALAICIDRYVASYPRAYLAAHQPVLALKIGGEAPSAWPKDSEGHNLDMGPYLISHPNFAPSFKILSHSDEPQIPWGVVRLEFRNESAVFAAIAPRGPQALDQQVQAGYRIAQQKCFHCHNLGGEGGQKAGRPWPVLSAWAAASPNDFAAYVRNPKKRNPQAQMPSLPEYDDATLRALTAYFQTFTIREKP
jgi:mono/diheme cytochrome c family protein